MFHGRTIAPKRRYITRLSSHAVTDNLALSEAKELCSPACLLNLDELDPAGSFDSQDCIYFGCLSLHLLYFGSTGTKGC
jgi:hypothetical protein